MKKIMPIFLIWMNVIEIILYLRKKKILDADMKQWKKYHPYSKEGILSLNYLLWFYKSFRSVFIYRTIGANRYMYILKFFIKRPPIGIEVLGNIGGGY